MPHPDLLSTIGGTPVAELHAVVPPGCPRVLVKLECADPTGSTGSRRVPRGPPVPLHRGGCGARDRSVHGALRGARQLTPGK